MPTSQFLHQIFIIMTYLKILLTKIIKNNYKQAFIWSATRFIQTILLLLVMLLKHPKTGLAVEILCLLSLNMLRGIPYIRKVILCWLKKSSFWSIDAKVTRFWLYWWNETKCWDLIWKTFRH